MRRIATILIVTASAACAADAQPESEARAAIDLLQQQYVAAIGAGDLEGMLANMTDDYNMMPPDAPAVIGSTDVRAFAQPIFEGNDLRQDFRFEDVRIAGDWAVAPYTYEFEITPKAGGDPVREVGKGIAILERQSDGSWLFARAAWNRNAPVPPTASAFSAR